MTPAPNCPGAPPPLTSHHSDRVPLAREVTNRMMRDRVREIVDQRRTSLLGYPSSRNEDVAFWQQYDDDMMVEYEKTARSSGRSSERNSGYHYNISEGGRK